MTLNRDRLLECLRIERWADAVAAGNPASVDALVAIAIAEATPLSDAEVDEALAAHPRIGERHAGSGAEASLSASEQADSRSDDADLAERLAAGNAAYDARFERVFLIRAAGRDRAEIVAELERRLANDDATERAEVAQQLLEIAELRLRSTFAYLDEETA